MATLASTAPAAFVSPCTIWLCPGTEPHCLGFPLLFPAQTCISTAVFGGLVLTVRQELQEVTAFKYEHQIDEVVGQGSDQRS